MQSSKISRILWCREAQRHPMNPHNFFAELKRRNVYKVAVAYAVVGWLLVQIATQVFPFLEIPNWVVRLGDRIGRRWISNRARHRLGV